MDMSNWVYSWLTPGIQLVSLFTAKSVLLILSTVYDHLPGIDRPRPQYYTFCARYPALYALGQPVIPDGAKLCRPRDFVSPQACKLSISVSHPGSVYIVMTWHRYRRELAKRDLRWLGGYERLD